jgi:hypothetical protein
MPVGGVSDPRAGIAQLPKWCVGNIQLPKVSTWCKLARSSSCATVATPARRFRVQQMDSSSGFLGWINLHDKEVGTFGDDQHSRVSDHRHSATSQYWRLSKLPVACRMEQLASLTSSDSASQLRML